MFQSPLPDEMVQYARTDTHYLLYIYDRMRAQLLDFNHGQPGLLQCVWSKSKDICLKVRLPFIYFRLPLHNLLHFPLFFMLPFFHAEICEAHIHGGFIFGAAEEAEKVFQHPAAHCLQTAVCLEGQAGQAGGWKHRVGCLKMGWLAVVEMCSSCFSFLMEPRQIWQPTHICDSISSFRIIHTVQHLSLNFAKFVLSDMSCQLIWWARYLRSCQSKLISYSILCSCLNRLLKWSNGAVKVTYWFWQMNHKKKH